MRILQILLYILAEAVTNMEQSLILLRTPIPEQLL